MILYIIVVLITIMFFLSSFQKIGNFDKVSEDLRQKVGGKFSDIPFPIELAKLFIIGAIMIQFFCPLIILYSVYDKRYRIYGSIASLILIFFTILATYFFHFPPRGQHYYAFMSNITTVGGLSLLSYFLYP